MRSWFLSLLEIVVVGKGLAVFITSLNCRYNRNLYLGKNTTNTTQQNMRRDIQWLLAMLCLLQLFSLISGQVKTIQRHAYAALIITSVANRLI